jgi:L,D-peptidoglycan transpeptidase YkuD (ErfK/YbiS/YcfS/YnhG family)
MRPRKALRGRVALRAAPPLLALALGAPALLASCAGAPHHGSVEPAARRPVRATVPATLPPTEPGAPPSTAAAPSPPATSPADAPRIDRVRGIDGSSQVMVASAGGYGQTTATFEAWQRGPSGWQQVFGPWAADIGESGFAAPGAKREGDGATPSGSFGFGFFFGVQPDPGVRFEYRQVTGTSIVWDDDPSSANYNEWVDDTRAPAGADPEPMYNVPAYDYGAVIAYNTARTPGLGSAIFLHVSTGGPTDGCVSLPEPELLQVLRWMDPSQSPRIVMGTLSAIASQP